MGNRTRAARELKKTKTKRRGRRTELWLALQGMGKKEERFG